MANQNITQNNIIMWLEDVVPQMQKSDNPTDTLLKYASDHNFSPAILERVGHMFNSLKTNSFYNLAKEASHRGDYISTLDVDDLVKQYEAFKPNELDFSKIKTNVKDNNIFSTGGSMKIASVSVRTGSINDLTVLSDVEVMSLDDGELKFAKAKKDILNNVDSFKSDSFKIAAPVEKPLFEKDPVDFEMQCKQAKQEAHLEYTKAVDIMESIEKKFANVYATHSLRKGHIPYANLEYKVLSNIDAEQYDSVKEAMDHLSDALKSRSMFLKETLKTASEAGLLDDPDFIDDGKEATLFNDVLDYSEAYHHAKEASEFIKEIEETKKEASTVIDPIQKELIKQQKYVTKLKKFLAENQKIKNMNAKTRADLEAEVKKHEMEIEKARSEWKKQLDQQYYDLKKNETDARTAESEAKTEYTKSKTTREEAESELNLLHKKLDREAKIKKDEKAETEELIKSVNKSVEQMGNSAIDFMTHGVIEPTKEAIRSVRSDMLGLYTTMMAAKAEKNESEKISPITKEVKQLQSKLVLEQLIYTDPVLSNLDDDALNSLMESYATIVRKNPDIALEPGLLRPLLRQIVAAGGLDMASAINVNKYYNGKHYND